MDTLRKELAKRKSVWLPCTSQHDTPMYKANGLRLSEFQTICRRLLYSWTSKRPLTQHGTSAMLQFTISLIKLIASFLTNRKFKVSVEGELSSPRKVAAGVPQCSVLAPILYSLYINDAPAAPGIHLALFSDDTCVYATGKHERRVLSKLQRGLTAVGSWCQRWSIKITKGRLRRSTSLEDEECLRTTFK
jgi:hypothetical protein